MSRYLLRIPTHLSLSKKSGWSWAFSDRYGRMGKVMQDAGTRENGSRSGRVRSHRPTGAEGAFAIVSLVPKWMRRTVTMEKLQLYSLSP